MRTFKTGDKVRLVDVLGLPDYALKYQYRIGVVRKIDSYAIYVKFKDELIALNRYSLLFSEEQLPVVGHLAIELSTGEVYKVHKINNRGKISVIDKEGNRYLNVSMIYFRFKVQKRNIPEESR